MSLSLAIFEILLVGVGICLLYWWTSREAKQADINLQSAFTASEDDYLEHMLKTVNETASLKKSLLTRQLQVTGKLSKQAMGDMQSLIVYYATRVGIQRQAQFRQERRFHFAEKNWTRYKAVIEQAEKVKEQRVVRFTQKLLGHLDIEDAVYIQSMKSCPNYILVRAREQSILKAYTDWFEMHHAQGRDLGLEPVKESTAKMAQVEFEVKMADLQNSGKRRSHVESLVERYKLEDFIFDTHRVETEHLLLLKKDTLERSTEAATASEASTEQQSTVHSTSHSGGSSLDGSLGAQNQSTNEDEDNGMEAVAAVMAQVADQPRDFATWTPDRQQQWFSNEFEKMLPLSLTKDEEALIPFKKMMQIQKIMHPRVDAGHLEKRRELYKAKDWNSYRALVKNSFLSDIQVASSGYKAYANVFGLTQRHLQRSIFTYSSDLDLREVMESLLIETVSSDATEQARQSDRDLTREEVIACVTERNQSQIQAIQSAQEKRKNGTQEVEADSAQEAMQIEIQTEMAKVRDKQYVEQGVSERDIERAIDKLCLEQDPDYQALMRHHTQTMNQL